SRTQEPLGGAPTDPGAAPMETAVLGCRGPVAMARDADRGPGIPAPWRRWRAPATEYWSTTQRDTINETSDSGKKRAASQRVGKACGEGASRLVSASPCSEISVTLSKSYQGGLRMRIRASIAM